MLFNSLEFLLFFIIVLGLNFITPYRFKWVLLLVASCFFYALFIPAYLILLAVIVLMNYFAAIGIEDAPDKKKKKTYYYIALGANILILIFFKYFNFFNDNLTALLGLAEIKNPIPYARIIFPLGISFQIFQSIGYIIDVKNKKIKAERHAGYYAVFITLFSKVVAGPIEKGKNLLPQLRENKKVDDEDLAVGFSQVMLGFFKKVVVGDMLGNYVFIFFGGYAGNSGFATLFACWIFLFQLYADFSGYSDIAIGTARMLGFKLKPNFALPLFSKTMTEVWRRWHMSLSIWLRDYLYSPIAMAKRDWGEKNAAIYSLMITFTICGIWHGAGWSFLVYGIVLGIFLAIELLFNIKSSFYNKNFFLKCVGVFITFNVFSFSLIFFRSSTLTESFGIIKNIFTNFFPLTIPRFDTSFFITMLSMLGILMAIDYFIFRNNSFEKLFASNKALLFFLNLLLLSLILLFGVSSNSQFIYFQF